jgi:hypothetical protein
MTALYKFIGNVEDARFLLKGCVKFTPIPELNDPSELMASVTPDDVRRSLERLRKDGYTDGDMIHLRRQGKVLERLAKRFQAIGVPDTPDQANAIIASPFYDNIPRLETLLRETAQEISSRVGLFCLTRRYDSLPMWAHYAANATGVVFEFRDLEDVFPGDDTGVLHSPISVRYERERLGVTFEPQSHDSLFFAKFDDWGYEQEVRVVVPLVDCRAVAASDRTLHLFDIPPRNIARVVLGWRAPPDSARRLVELVQENNPDVEVRQAEIEGGRVRIGALLHPLENQ